MSKRAKNANIKMVKELITDIIETIFPKQVSPMFAHLVSYKNQGKVSKKNLRPQDKAPGLQGFHYTNILVNQLILLLFFPFVGVFVIYVQVKKCQVTTGVHSVCRVPFTNRPNHVATY